MDRPTRSSASFPSRKSGGQASSGRGRGEVAIRRGCRPRSRGKVSIQEDRRGNSNPSFQVLREDASEDALPPRLPSMPLPTSTFHGSPNPSQIPLRSLSTAGLGRPVLRLRWDHVGLRGWSGPGRGELTRELTAIDSGDRRDDGTHGTSVRANRRGFSASFSRTRGDARSPCAVGLEDTSRGQKKRGFPRVRTEEDGTLFLPRKSVERGRERQGTTWDRFGLGFRV